jgi:hypothetical protein
MHRVKLCLAVLVVLTGLSTAEAQPVCDAPTEAGWRVVLSTEITNVKDGAPYRSGSEWLVERITTLMPLCSYFSPVGSYSLKSYSLDPFEQTERVSLCHGASPVAPYAGPCPPK